MSLSRPRRGWEEAIRLLPAAIAARLLRPPEDILRSWGPLPRTLLHGDSKVANFAILPDRRVAAFDWGCIGAGPASLDLGWYLAVNATRIRGTKESFVARYRERLEAALGHSLPEGMWSALVSAAVESGAMMLLWSKALALERDDAAARAEWDWWVAILGRG
jgi:aminoglycoside phosphotransferase (APT) family kinase protein